MRVYEVAKELNIPAEALLQHLHDAGVNIRSEASTVDDAVVAKLRARVERERRGGQDAGTAIEAVIGETQGAGGRRRRRRRKVDEPQPEVTAADSSASPAADAADAIAAEAAEAAEEAGALTADAEQEEITAELEEAREPAAPEEALVAEGEPALAAEAELEAEGEEAAKEDAEVEAEPEVAPVAEGEEAAPAEEAERIAAEAERPEVEAEAEEAEREVSAPAAEKRPARARPRRVGETLPLPPRQVRRPSEPAEKPAPAASAGPGGQVRIQAEGFTTDGRRKEKRKKKRQRVNQDAVQENIQRVMAELKGGSRKRRRARGEAPSRQEREAERKRVAAEEAQTVRVNEYLTVAELADLIDQNPTEIISSAFKNLGLMVTINQRLDFDQIELLLEEFGFRAVRETEYGTGLSETEGEVESTEGLTPRPPVVTVMGHVDHGKTLLLDYIRKANVVAGESGGITQHIGAYHVTVDDDRALTFLDTPGHAAFTAMRARGAEVTDAVILVVAADDSVMPQTIEAISHAKNAGVPIVVAVNKVDLPTADPSRVRQQLLQHHVMVEEFGGNVLSADVSAKSGQGVDDLLDKVLLQAELLELRANPDRPAQGTVVEAQLDVGKGPVATILVTNGTLRVGDPFVCGVYEGRVRALLDERGNHIEAAGPAIPAQVLGLSGVPQAGDTLVVMEAERAAGIAQTRQRLEREKQIRIKSRGVKLTDISQLLAQGEAAQLNLIIKGDVDGSVQALSDALGQLATSEVEVEVVHHGVGAINESDVLLAATAGAIIIGFHVRPDANARAVAAREDVDVRLYSVIYEAVEDVRAALEGLLQPEEREVLLGAAEVRQLFKVPRVGTIAGCYVTEGLLDRRSRARVVRDGIQVYEGELASLKRFKDDVREVREGFECGLNIAGFNDIKVGDTIECYRVESVSRTLASSASESS